MRFILCNEFGGNEIIEPPMIAQGAVVLIRGDEVWTSDPEQYDVYERKFTRVDKLMVWKIQPDQASKVED